MQCPETPEYRVCPDPRPGSISNLWSAVIAARGPFHLRLDKTAIAGIWEIRLSGIEDDLFHAG